MIYVDMKGNIGNQLFIYAFARKIQTELNMPIEISYYNLKKYFHIEDENLRIFKLCTDIRFSNKKFMCVINSNNIIRKIFNKILPSKILKLVKNIEFYIFKIFGVLFWDETSFKKIDFSKLRKFKNIYVVGYWQSPKYFDDIKILLKEDLQLRTKLSDKNKPFLNYLKNNNCICVSIRRGDYISNKKNKNKYYLCDLEYFYNALELIFEEYTDCKIVCFSDDIEWVKKNLLTDCEIRYEKANSTLTDKITLMRECKYFIISNSSFSWWIQYLANDNRMVVAPSRWYRKYKCDDIYQNNWKLINVGSDKID